MLFCFYYCYLLNIIIGAEDDGSGAAAVLEMVRIFSTFPPPMTTVFVFFSGEEQGLYLSLFIFRLFFFFFVLF